MRVSPQDREKCLIVQVFSRTNVRSSKFDSKLATNPILEKALKIHTIVWLIPLLSPLCPWTTEIRTSHLHPISPRTPNFSFQYQVDQWPVRGQSKSRSAFQQLPRQISFTLICPSTPSLKCPPPAHLPQCTHPFNPTPPLHTLALYNLIIIYKSLFRRDHARACVCVPQAQACWVFRKMNVLRFWSLTSSHLISYFVSLVLSFLCFSRWPRHHIQYTKLPPVNLGLSCATPPFWRVRSHPSCFWSPTYLDPARPSNFPSLLKLELRPSPSNLRSSVDDWAVCSDTTTISDGAFIFPVLLHDLNVWQIVKSFLCVRRWSAFQDVWVWLSVKMSKKLKFHVRVSLEFAQYLKPLCRKKRGHSKRFGSFLTRAMHNRVLPSSRQGEHPSSAPLRPRRKRTSISSCLFPSKNQKIVMTREISLPSNNHTWVEYITKWVDMIRDHHQKIVTLNSSFKLEEGGREGDEDGDGMDSRERERNVDSERWEFRVRWRWRRGRFGERKEI